MADKILNLFSPKVVDFRKEKVNEYDTIYEVTFSAEPMIDFDEETESITCGPQQTFYLIYNPYLPTYCSMVISDLSIIDCIKGEDMDEYFWEKNTNNIILSDKHMLKLYENILFSLLVFNDSISMFTSMDSYISGLHEDYIYGPMLEGKEYLEFLQDAFMEESDNAKEQ